MQTLRNIFYLVKLCTRTRQGKIGLGYAVLVIGLNILLIRISLRMITWNRDFYNALEKYDMHNVVTQIGIFILITFAGAVTYLAAEYLRKLLVITWRKVLNDTILEHWLSNKVYWHLNFSQDHIDNPDQRISEDCRLFLERLTNEGFLLITKIIGLFSYFVVLWNITSGFILSFTFLGVDISIAHYMIWLAPIYVLISSYITHWVGNPLKKIMMQQQYREANYRFALMRFRESKEPIALLNGEEVERGILDKKLQAVIKNWHFLIRREFFLGCFTRPYNLSIFQIPTFFALPIYLVSKVSLGSLMQISKAFVNVTLNLSWFIFYYDKLAELIACSNRLNQLLQKTQELSNKSYSSPIKVATEDRLDINGLIIKTPDGKTLCELPELRLTKGESVVLSGASGIGKSTLFKTLAGLYPYFYGDIILPNSRKMFLPQTAYFPMGGLAHAVAYPNMLVEKNLEHIKQILQDVGFSQEYIDQKLLDTDLTLLSGGEKQRLIIARILMQKPDWVFMDEATNALDKASEQQLVQLLQNSLPTSSFVIISHTSLQPYFKRCYQLNL